MQRDGTTEGDKRLAHFDLVVGPFLVVVAAWEPARQRRARLVIVVDFLTWWSAFGAGEFICMTYPDVLAEVAVVFVILDCSVSLPPTNARLTLCTQRLGRVLIDLLLSTRVVQCFHADLRRH